MVAPIHLTAARNVPKAHIIPAQVPRNVPSFRQAMSVRNVLRDIRGVRAIPTVRTRVSVRICMVIIVVV